MDRGVLAGLDPALQRDAVEGEQIGGPRRQIERHHPLLGLGVLPLARFGIDPATGVVYGSKY